MTPFYQDTAALHDAESRELWEALRGMITHFGAPRRYEYLGGPVGDAALQAATEAYERALRALRAVSPPARECSQCHHDLTLAESYDVVNMEPWCLKCSRTPVPKTDE